MLQEIGRRDLATVVDLIEISHNIYALKFEFDSPMRLQANTRIWYKTDEEYIVYVLTESLSVSSEQEIEESIRLLSDLLNHR